jgi:hypothetical protein
MSNEPTVLDYLHSLFRRGGRIDLESFFAGHRSACPTSKNRDTESQNAGIEVKSLRVSLYFFVGLLSAGIAQLQLEPPTPNVIPAILIYSMSFGFLFFGLKDSGNSIGFKKETDPSWKYVLRIRNWALLVGLFLLTLAFILFRGNEFTFQNVALWISGLGLIVYSLWQEEYTSSGKNEFDRIFIISAILIAAISLFFRFYLLDRVPGEMFSDQAEKLYDVMDVLSGRTPIFFIRNTGREPLQFYLTAAIVKIFNSGISFLSLKIGTAFAGFLTLFFIYLLGSELAGKWVGLGAAFFAGIAYWPNVISRVGLRFTFYPLFVAPVLYFLFKGLRERRLNYLILTGLFLGFGLHGYSPIRVLPVLVTVIFVLFGITHKEREDRHFAAISFLLVILTSLIVFIPLLRYLFENPGSFNYRLASRLTSIENPINDPVILIFLGNFWRSITMFFCNNGVTWVNSIPNRPALDVLSAVFFFIGLVRLGFNLFTSQGKKWREFSLLISIPILMLPSILSLAYPAENPSLNRSSGAIVPVFFVCAYGFVTIASEFTKRASRWLGKIAAFTLLFFLVLGSLLMNYDLVFNQYADQFLRNAWNSSEIGAQIARFTEAGNNPDNAFVVPYPHWVDTRLVGIHAGIPGRDYALWADDLVSTEFIAGQKLFIIKPEDQQALDTIKSLYPDAQEEIFYSRTPGKDFIMIYVEKQ